jgi:hypothetical protein
MLLAEDALRLRVRAAHGLHDGSGRARHCQPDARALEVADPLAADQRPWAVKAIVPRADVVPGSVARGCLARLEDLFVACDVLLDIEQHHVAACFSHEADLVGQVGRRVFQGRSTAYVHEHRPPISALARAVARQAFRRIAESELFQCRAHTVDDFLFEKHGTNVALGPAAAA